MITQLRNKLIKPVYAHCDLMCGVYDPAQARIEAQSVYNAAKKYQDSDDDVFRQRCISIKEKRAELAKHHIWVLWTDYFKPEHVKDHPELHELIWKAAKAAGDAKKSVDPADAQTLIECIDKIGAIFAKTKDGYDYETVKANMESQAA